jgi:hypothetical protein
MYALSVSVDVNPPSARPRLSQEQVWRGLVMKSWMDHQRHQQ